MTLNTMVMAVALAGLQRDEFASNVARVEQKKVKWPRKRYNNTTGVRKDVKTMEAVGKVN